MQGNENNQEDKKAQKARKKLAKKYKISKVRKKLCERNDFSEKMELLSKATNVDNLTTEIKEVIANDGRVFAVKNGKKFVGIYIFSYDAKYFEEKVDINQGIDKTQKSKYEEIVNAIYFDNKKNKGALVLTNKFLLDEAGEVIDFIEKDILALIKDSLEYDKYSGIEWGDKLYYRNYQKAEIGGHLYWAVLGFIVGFIIGWLCLDSALLGISFGLSYAVLWGLTFSTVDINNVSVADNADADISAPKNNNQAGDENGTI